MGHSQNQPEPSPFAGQLATIVPRYQAVQYTFLSSRAVKLPESCSAATASFKVTHVRHFLEDCGHHLSDFPFPNLCRCTSTNPIPLESYLVNPINRESLFAAKPSSSYVLRIQGPLCFDLHSPGLS